MPAGRRRSRWGKRMRPVLPSLFALMLLASCDGGGLFPPVPPPQDSAIGLRVGFPPGGVVDTIVVNAVDRLPLRAAALVAPDGVAIPASYIDAVASPGFATGQRAAGNPWQ